MAETTQSIQILVEREVCSRVCAVNSLKLQALNLNLDPDYIALLDSWLLEALRLDTQEEVTALYDLHYDTILAQRDDALTQFVEGLKAKITIPDKTPTPP